MNVAILDSGVANLASVESAFRSLGVSTHRVQSAREIEAASHVVLPGVGSFGAGMSRLRELHLKRSIEQVVEQKRPLLAICLGLQLLCDASDEDPGVAGLGVIRATCRRLPETVRVPQLGWNLVEPDGEDQMVRQGKAAFANSYALFDAPAGWRRSTTTYGQRFISALERDRTLACQFHPELSGTYGLALLKRWITGSESHIQTDSNESERLSVSATGVASPALDGVRNVRIIPCLDVRDGRVVKGIQFQNIRDAGDPAELAEAYERQGADEIVVLDIAAAPRGADTRVETVRRVRDRIHIPLTIGGGVRSVDDARRLLSAGADKISVNSAATKDPALINRLAAAFGSQCVVCAIDARRKGNVWEVLVNGGRESTNLNAVTWARQVESYGAGEILLTSWDRDGTREGADESLVSAVSSAVRIPVIASGGIGSPADALSAVLAGASAVLAASIFHDAELEVSDLKMHLNNEGVEVRL